MKAWGDMSRGERIALLAYLTFFAGLFVVICVLRAQIQANLFVLALVLLALLLAVGVLALVPLSPRRRKWLSAALTVCMCVFLVVFFIRVENKSAFLLRSGVAVGVVVVIRILQKKSK